MGWASDNVHSTNTHLADIGETFQQILNNIIGKKIAHQST